MTSNPTGQRVSDEAAEVIAANSGSQVITDLVADLRAAREENRRLQERIEAAETVIGAACEAADGGEPVDRLVRLMMSRIQYALGDGSSD